MKKPILDDAKYPEKKKDEWHQTELGGKEKLAGVLFTKKYHGFFLEVMLIEDKGAYSVKGRIFQKTGENEYVSKYDSPPGYFAGPTAYNDAMNYAIGHECREVQKFVDIVLG